MLRERDLPCESIDQDTVLTEELGLTSMDALQLLALIDTQFGTRLPFEKWIVIESGYRTRVTVRELTFFIEEHFHHVPGVA